MVLKVQMLGGFSMNYGGRAIMLNRAGSSKSARLFQMLLLSPKNGISKQELMDNLYICDEKTDTVNRSKNLNSLVCRLKKQLVSCGLPDDEYVGIDEGMYCFRSSIRLELDTQRFEETIKMAKAVDAGAEHIRLLRQASEMYGGELLPENQTETWFFQKANHFKKLYIDIIEELGQEFLTAEDHRSRLLLYSKAADIYPLENWPVNTIQSNLKMYSSGKVMEACDGSTEIFGQKSKGAYYCTYPGFVNYCRMAGRNGNSSGGVMMFLTLSRRGRQRGSKEINLLEQMGILKGAIGESLRTGDAYTQCGDRHFIVMVARTKREYCSNIFNRIEKAYEEKSGTGELWYYADMPRGSGCGACGPGFSDGLLESIRIHMKG